MRELDLGDAGVSWVRQSLEAGGKFAELVLRDCGVDAGSSWADVPDAHELSGRSIDLKSSGAPGGVQTQAEYFAARAARLLSDDFSLLVEDEIWRSGDPVRVTGSGLRLELGGGQLFVLDSAGAEDPAVFVRRHSFGYPTNTFFVPVVRSKAAWIEPSRALTEGARKVRALAVAAWDAEGFVWWRPRR